MSDLPNGVDNGRIISAGQPNAEQLKALPAADVKTVINLRQNSEMNFDEEAVVRAAGMNYVLIEVAGPTGLTKTNAKALHDALEANPGRVLVHCGSANRVGALMAIRAKFIEGKTVDEALAVGAAYGLTGMRPAAERVLKG